MSLLLILTLMPPGSCGDSLPLSLSEAVRRAVASHPTVAVAQARAEGARAGLSEATAAWWPRLALDGAVNRFQQPMVVLPLHGFDVRNPPLFDRTLVQAGLSLSWTVFDFGARAARVRTQRALVGAAEAARSATELELVERVVGAYLRVLSTRQVLAAQDQRRTALEAAADRTRQWLAEGKAARLDSVRIEAELGRARADRIAAASELELAERQLARLIQVPFERIHGQPLAPVALADSALATDTASALQSALVARARSASGDLRELEQRARAAEAAVGAARASWFPELRLGGGYLDRGRWWSDFSAEWQVGVALSYPIFTGGARWAALQRADAERRAAAEQVRAAALQVEDAVDRTLAELRRAHARSAALALAVQQAAEVVRIERLALEVGTGVQTDYLQAEAALLAARSELVQARAAEIAARVSLARLVGELSVEWLARTLEVAP